MKNTDPEINKSLSEVVEAIQAGEAQKAEFICRDFLIINAASVPHLQLLGHALVKQEKLKEAKSELEKRKLCVDAKVAVDDRAEHERVDEPAMYAMVLVQAKDRDNMKKVLESLDEEGEQKL